MNKNYSIDFKKEVIRSYEMDGLTKTEEKYCVAQVTILNWYRAFNTYGIEGLKKKNVRRYSIHEKIRIVNYYKAYGLVETETRYRVNHSIFLGWMRQLSKEDDKTMCNQRKPDKIEQSYEELLEEVKLLRIENKILKKLKALRLAEEQQRKSVN